MSVQEYLDKHTLSRKIEDAVNAAVRAKTSDPVLFIVSLFRPPNDGAIVVPYPDDRFRFGTTGESYEESCVICDNEGQSTADP